MAVAVAPAAVEGAGDAEVDEEERGGEAEEEEEEGCQEDHDENFEEEGEDFGLRFGGRQVAAVGGGGILRRHFLGEFGEGIEGQEGKQTQSREREDWEFGELGNWDVEWIWMYEFEKMEMETMGFGGSRAISFALLIFGISFFF